MIDAIGSMLLIRKDIITFNNGNEYLLATINFVDGEAELIFDVYCVDYVTYAGSFSFYEMLFILCDDLAQCLYDFVNKDYLDAINDIQIKYLSTKETKAMNKLQVRGVISEMMSKLAAVLDFTGEHFDYALSGIEIDIDNDVTVQFEVTSVKTGNYVEIIPICESSLLSNNPVSENLPEVETRYYADLNEIQRQYKAYLNYIENGE